MQYDVLIVGGGPGGIYSAYELLKKRLDRRSPCLRRDMP